MHSQEERPRFQKGGRGKARANKLHSTQQIKTKVDFQRKHHDMSIEEETKRYDAYSSRAHNAGSHGAKLGTGKARAKLYQHHKLQPATTDYHGDYEPEFYSEQRRYGQYEDPNYQRGGDYNSQGYYGGQYGYENGNAGHYYGGSQSVRKQQHSRHPAQPGNGRKKR